MGKQILRTITRRRPRERGYNIIGVVGQRGYNYRSGKTILLVKMAVDQEQTAKDNHRTFKYKYVYANFHLFGIDNFVFLGTKLSKKKMFSKVEDQSLILLDEGNQYLSHRRSLSKEVNDLLCFFDQAGKKECDVYITMPSGFWFDKHLKEMFTNCILAKGPIIPGLDTFEYQGFQFNLHGDPLYEHTSFYLNNMSAYYPYYDHKETIVR